MLMCFGKAFLLLQAAQWTQKDFAWYPLRKSVLLLVSGGIAKQGSYKVRVAMTQVSKVLFDNLVKLFPSRLDQKNRDITLRVFLRYEIEVHHIDKKEYSKSINPE
jgi:hypothetical protein